MPKDNLFVPRIIHIDITGKCNFECLHCRGRFSNKSIELSHFKRIIDNIFENWNNDLKWMEIGGGEPLLHKDLAKMIHYIKKKNKKIRIIVVSNGSLFNEKKAKELKSAGITRIQFSLDGVNAETHNWLRQNDSSFRKVMDAIEIAKKDNIDFVLRMTINNKNLNQIEDFFKLGKEKGAVELGLRGCIYVGNAEENTSELYLDKETYSKILVHLPLWSKKYNMPYFSGDPLALVANKELIEQIEKKFGSLDHYSGCSVGISYMYINNDGNVSFCPMLNNIEIAKLESRDIKDVWDNCLEFIHMRKRDMGGKCGKCKFLKLCGGCCAYGYWKEKKLFAENPICCFFVNKNMMEV
ncbi:radical SAM protein [Candidatus Woesearchaeota archaeon]|nr:radical SAM protein [Candidatus Woesearchaeota archaeon]